MGRLSKGMGFFMLFNSQKLDDGNYCITVTVGKTTRGNIQRVEILWKTIYHLIKMKAWKIESLHMPQERQADGKGTFNSPNCHS